MLDVVTFGEVMAMFVATESGPLERAANFNRALAGAETNVAIGLARLGHRVGWVGRVGEDHFGRFALAELASHGVDTAAVSFDPEAATGFQLKSRADGGDPEVAYFRRNSAGSRLAPSPATDAYIALGRHLHVTGIPLALSPSTRAFTLRAITIARESGSTVSFDPNLRAGLWASKEEMIQVTNDVAATADWVLPGLTEGRLLSGLPGADADQVARFYLDLGAERVIVKAAVQGASLHTRAGRWDRPIFPVEVVDTVGAGDGFAAGLISAHLEGLSVEAALERAAAIGALATTSSGDKDGLPDRPSLAAFLAEQHLAVALN
ncbi:sugar kinase [Paenarthrobacter sp. Z7-10]|nr:sugar kinase [Paenarthrobacter sp. Z7-10]